MNSFVLWEFDREPWELFEDEDDDVLSKFDDLADGEEDEDGIYNKHKKCLSELIFEKKNMNVLYLPKMVWISLKSLNHLLLAQCVNYGSGSHRTVHTRTLANKAPLLFC